MFLDNFIIAARQVGILYVMVLVGVVCDRIGLFTEKTGKACTDLLFYIITQGQRNEAFDCRRMRIPHAFYSDCN